MRAPRETKMRRISECHLVAGATVFGLLLGALVISAVATESQSDVGLVWLAEGPGSGDSGTRDGSASAAVPGRRPPVQVMIGEGSCVSATSSACPSTDPAFGGYWKYTVTIGWDVGRYGRRFHSLSDISIVLGLEGCQRADSPSYFAMTDTVGASNLGEGCTVYYRSEVSSLACPGSPQPALGLTFRPYEHLCGQCLCGTARVTFYSLAPPKPVYSFPSSVLVRFGRYMVLGSLDGPLPACADTPQAVEPSTWGSIKALTH